MKITGPAIALSSLFFLVGPADGQTVVGPPGVYQVQTPSTTTQERGENWIKFTWSLAPQPGPTPNPPTPPGPTPSPPDPSPAPSFGKLARILVLYESQVRTGTEPFQYDGFYDALNGAVPPGKDGMAAWRIWDKDVEVGEGEWAVPFAQAKASQAGSTDAILYAWDDKGVMAPPVPLKAMTLAEAVQAIQKLQSMPTLKALPRPTK